MPQLRKASTREISSGNETHCRMNTILHPPYPWHHYFLIAKQFLFFLIYIYFFFLCSFVPGTRLLKCNVTQPPAAVCLGKAHRNPDVSHERRSCADDSRKCFCLLLKKPRQLRAKRGAQSNPCTELRAGEEKEFLLLHCAASQTIFV